MPYTVHNDREHCIVPGKLVKKSFIFYAGWYISYLAYMQILHPMNCHAPGFKIDTQYCLLLRCILRVFPANPLWCQCHIDRHMCMPYLWTYIELCVASSDNMRYEMREFGYEQSWVCRLSNFVFTAIMILYFFYTCISYYQSCHLITWLR